MNRLIIFFFFACTFLSFISAGAQENKLLQRVQQANDFRNVSYKYTVSLLDVRKNKVTDSITGHYVQANGTYSDSNSIGFSLLSGGYYCSIDHQRKQADIYSIRALEKKRGRSPDAKSIASAMASLPEEGEINMKTDSTGALYKITWTLKSNPRFRTYMEVRRSDYRVLLFRYETPDDMDATLQYKRICLLYDLVYTAGQVMHPESVFTVKGKTITLVPKYQQYHLSTLTE